MATLSRRAALAALGAGGLVGLGYVLRGLWGAISPGANTAGDTAGANQGQAMMGARPTDAGMMGSGMMGSGMGTASAADMSIYMEMFKRHGELRRRVEEIPGGVRTTTESDSPDLIAQLKSHVSAMYTHLDQGAEVRCMSQSLPTLFRHARNYRRRISLTRNGVIAEETADEPAIIEAIRAHAREVSGFVSDGMPAMMRQMMGG